MNAKLTLQEVCAEIAKQERNAYMGGSNQFDYDAWLIALIYDVDLFYISFLVKEEYDKLIRK